MDFDTIALLVLLSGVCLFLVKARKSLQFSSFLRVFYFCMLRTRLGMGVMERWARRHEPLLLRAGYVMIPVCFVGMFVMIEELVRGAVILLQQSEALAVGVVLPIQAKGVFYVPFMYWLLAVLFVMVVHEFGHGIIARAHRVRVKSTGLAFLGAIIPIVPGAFVEIDEKALARRSRYTQLSIFAAGPFVNVLFGILFWGAFLFVQPAADGLFVSDGMRVLQVAENSPAAITGMAVGELIKSIDGKSITDVESFDNAFAAKAPGDQITIVTDKATRASRLAGAQKSYLGVQVEEARHLKESVIASHGLLLPKAFVWLVDLLFWLFVLNLGVGLFNLVPLGPIDGGRMFHAVLEHVLRHNHARAVWHATSFVMLAIIVSTLVSAFV